MDLEEAIRKRDSFLKEHPDMEEYQEYINDILSKCTNQNDKIIALLIMLNNKMKELKDIINE